MFGLNLAKSRTLFVTAAHMLIDHTSYFMLMLIIIMTPHKADALG